MFSDSRDSDNRDVDDKIRKITKNRDVVNQETRMKMVHDCRLGRLCDTKYYCRKVQQASHASSTSSGFKHDLKFGSDLKLGPDLDWNHRDQSQHVFEGYCPELDDSPSSDVQQEL